jgi:FKBP-type peptidyl-prolyl cis-trans isomerase
MQKSLITALLLAAATMLAGDGLAQQTPGSTPAAPTSTAPAATTPKAPAKKTTTPAKPAAAAAPALTTRKQKFSYALGMNIGSGLGANLKKQSVEVDPALVSQGLKDALAGTKTRLTEDEAKAVLTEMQNEVKKEQQEKAAQLGAANKKEGEEFLAGNKGKEGVVTLPSGLQYKILTEGKGPKPTAADTVVCNYKGTLINGTEFDSSYKRGQPATFGVGQVIKGWTEALQLMPVGSKWQLFIPSNLAYGERGAGADIGPDATLIFEVELLSIQPKADDKAKEEKKDDKAKDEKKDEEKKQ